MKQKVSKVLSTAILVVSGVMLIASIFFQKQVVAAYGSYQTPLSLNKPEVLLGNIVAGETTSFRIPFSNKHLYSVRIVNITTSCGCTLAGASVKYLKPFGRGIMTVTVHPSFYGDALKMVRVDTDHGSLNIPIKFVGVKKSGLSSDGSGGAKLKKSSNI